MPGRWFGNGRPCCTARQPTGGQKADAWRFAVASQDDAIRPAMTVRGPAAATVLFLRLLGCPPTADSPGPGGDGLQGPPKKIRRRRQPKDASKGKAPAIDLSFGAEEGSIAAEEEEDDLAAEPGDEWDPLQEPE